MAENELDLVLTVAWQLSFRLYLDYLKYSLHEAVFCVTVTIDGTAWYWIGLIKTTLE